MSKQLVTTQDLRELPAYSIAEAAGYLRLPKSTLRAWLVGQPYRVGEVQRFFRPVIEIADAKHLMYAEANACDWFVTTDPHFLVIRTALERLCARAKIRTPAQLLGELS